VQQTALRAQIADNPFLPICRSQIDLRYGCDDLQLAERMPGFHWVTCYGDWLRECGYSLAKVPIRVDCLG